MIRNVMGLFFKTVYRYICLYSNDLLAQWTGLITQKMVSGFLCT